MSATSTPMRSTCHCGAITVTVNRLPKYINVCQCTLCRRYGVAWGYYHPDEVKLEKKPNAATKRYIWGDKTASFEFCDHCGCMCYWWPLEPPTDGSKYQMGLNTNNMNPELLKYVDRTWEYAQLRMALGSKELAHSEDLAEYL
ncbi:Mss4-like protein [Elsinoe ampelina]|uniref:Mss4-like protein n=1 Tax=Elsinoe ampelina TaxID=302913 RepID=A0A6A6G9H6_9PEZI|nr:Mss4-like protein [Elsinoe ampelina]